MDPFTSGLLGGAAALGARGVLKYAANVWNARRELREYACGYDSRRGEPGALQHGWGGAACDVATRRELWAHSIVRHEHFRGDGTLRLVQHTIFGPYTNDFGRPGFFKIAFQFRGRGFEENRLPILTFDVQQAPYGKSQDYFLLAQKVVHGSELTGDFQVVELQCYTTGVGVFEYRVSVEPSTFDPLRHELTFEKVQIHRVLPIQDVL